MATNRENGDAEGVVGIGLGSADCIACQHRLCARLPAYAPPDAQVFRNLKRGDRLLMQDRTCRRFWIVIAGTAATCTSLRDGRRQIIGLERSGALICAMSAGAGGENWLEALEDCRICELDLSAATEPLGRDPELMRLMFQNVHHRLESLAVQVVALGRFDSMERVCLFLAGMARSAGAADKPGQRVRLPMSREDIADYLGLNAETVSRLLSRIKKSGLAIFLSPTDYVVPDLARLESRVPISTEGAASGRHADAAVIESSLSAGGHHP